jgi:hypothetical protein
MKMMERDTKRSSKNREYRVERENSSKSKVGEFLKLKGMHS